MNNYESFKETGVQWLGAIPTHWTFCQLRHAISQMRTGLNPRNNFILTNDDEFFYVTIRNFKDGVLYLDDNCDKINRKAWEIIQERSDLRKGDILFASISHNGQAVLVKENPYNWNINESVFKLRFKKLVLPEFAYYVLTSDVFYNEMASDATGSTFKSIKQNRLRANYFPLPPIDEQKAISDYLDIKTTELDEEKQNLLKQIELLKELKQSIILNAVMHGLHKDVEMKDSECDWLGLIPKSWSVKAYKYCMEIENGKDYKEVVSEEGYPVMGSGGQFAYASSYLYDGEAVLLGRKGTIDKPLYYKGKFWSVDTMFYAHPKGKNFCKFMYYAALCFPFDKYSTATALPSMTQTDLGNHKIAVPPVEEQKCIADYLDVKTAAIDEQIQLQEQQIKLIDELKQSIISQAVTGKIKVF